jgi:integron integrase
LQISRFGEFLLQRQLVPEKNAPFHVFWVRGFLGEPPDPGVALEDRVAGFLDGMRSEGREDWQVEQAEQALHLYFHNFQKATDWKAVSSEDLEPNEHGRYRREGLRQALRERVRVRHYSYRTEQTYCDWVDRFFAYADEVEPGAQEGGDVRVTPALVKDFLARLATKDHVSASTQNQALSALLFLCREVVDLDLGDITPGVRAKRGRKLPVVLSPPEVLSVLDEMKGMARLMAELIYGGGLRVSECYRLRVKDVDFDNRLLFVRSGKGDKDRSTLLAASVVPGLREHLDEVRRLYDADRKAGVGPVYLPDAVARKYSKAGTEWGWFWVFPSRTLSTDPRAGVVRRHHISSTVIQKAVRDAAKAACPHKPVSVHTLRHSFATHLLLSGVDIRQIQDYLGHANVETTMVYTHVVKDLRSPAESPLDALMKGDGKP